MIGAVRILSFLHAVSGRTVTMVIVVLASAFMFFGFGPMEAKPMQLTVVYNNLPFDKQHLNPR